MSDWKAAAREASAAHLDRAVARVSVGQSGRYSLADRRAISRFLSAVPARVVTVAGAGGLREWAAAELEHE